MNKYYKVCLGENSSLELTINGSREFINKLDIAISQVVKKEEDSHENPTLLKEGAK